MTVTLFFVLTICIW